MASTAVGNDPVEPVYLILDEIMDCFNVLLAQFEGRTYPEHRDVIWGKEVLAKYEARYGKGAKRVRHIKHPNGVFTVDGENAS